jgi:hypothetical protein
MIRLSKEGTICLLEEGTTNQMEEDTDDSSKDRVMGDEVCETKLLYPKLLYPSMSGELYSVSGSLFVHLVSLVLVLLQCFC